jgi:protein SCO1/2
MIILMVRQGKNVYKHLPYIGNPEGIAPNGDTIRHSIRPFTFTDQHGKPFSSESLKGNIYVAEFFFTSCNSICPVMTKGLKSEIFDTYANSKKMPDFRMVSFTINPEIDSPARLNAYAAKFGITSDKWIFLTAPKDSIYKLMGPEGFLMIEPRPEAGTNQLVHSKFVELVDKEGHIRGTYDATDHKELERLSEDIRLLMVQYARGQEPQR